MSEIIDQLIERCSEANLEYEAKENEDSSKQRLFVNIPEARSFRRIMIRNDEIAEQILNSQFENYKYIKGYDAVWSSSENAIEAEITLGRPLPPTRVVRMLWKIIDEELEIDDEEEMPEPKDFPDRIELESSSEDLKITIGKGSIEHAALTQLQLESRYFMPSLRRRSTIRLDGIDVTRHDQARKLLKRIANAVFFKVDLLIDTPFHLKTQRPPRRRRFRRNLDSVNWSAPRYKYDPEPLSLYWYGRNAVEMPLLQFLAYYQVLEFYFPVYSYDSAKETIRNIIRDPRFDIERDKDITRILDTIKYSGGGRALGDEKSQMKATVEACVSDTDVRQFIQDEESRFDFYSAKRTKGLSDINVPVNDEKQDLRPHISTRLYQIRCRIVHTKNEENDLGLILPYSLEVRKISHDLDLIQYLAQRVIIANGRTLNL